MPDEEQTTVLGIFAGGAFQMVSQDIYRTHADAMLEAIANANDANATEIWVCINYKDNFIYIRDNGEGVSLEYFNRVLSEKTKPGVKTGKGKIGQFNAGFLAPLGKCEYFTFTSKAKEHGAPYYCWTFNTEEIFATPHELNIRRETLPYKFSTKPEKVTDGVPWRSEVMLHGLSFDHSSKKPKAEEVASKALKDYREPMSKLGTKLHILQIDAKGETVYRRTHEAASFTGKPLDVWTVKKGSRIQTRIELYLSNRSGSMFKGSGLSFHVLGEAYSNDVSDFFDFITKDRDLKSLVSKDLATALKSGMFEGKITSSLLKLQRDRKSYEVNDSLIDFLIHLEKWWEEVGKALYEETNKNKGSQLFSKCAKKAQEEFKKLIDNPDVKSLLSNLKKRKSDKPAAPGFKPDKDGDEVIKGDFGPYPQSDDNPEAKPTTTSTGGGGRPGGQTKGRDNPNGDINVLATVQDKPKASKKHQDLQLVESTELDADTPWHIDKDKLTVLVNVEHHYYAICYDEENGRSKRITEYQKKVLFQALSLVSSGSSVSDPEWSSSQQVLFKELFLEVLNITG